jgi:hypothetical protein
MDLAIVITIVVLTFGAGGWFYKINTQLAKLGKDITPLIILHKKELIEYYLSKGIMPNPGMTPRKQYLIDKLQAGTLSYFESQELSNILKAEEKRAKESGNTDALVAILGLLALVAIIAALLKK